MNKINFAIYFYQWLYSPKIPSKFSLELDLKL